jgi:hypothetical protein
MILSEAKARLNSALMQDHERQIYSVIIAIVISSIYD